MSVDPYVPPLFLNDSYPALDDDYFNDLGEHLKLAIMALNANITDQAALTNRVKTLETSGSGGGSANLDALTVSVNSKVAKTSLVTKNLMDYGALGDGVTDDYQAFVKALQEIPTTGGVLTAPANKTFYLGTALTIVNRSNLTIDLNGSAISAPTLSAEFFKIRGTLGTSPISVTAPIAKNDTTITVANATGITVGDYYILSGNEPFNGDRPTAEFKGEYVRVTAVNNNVVSVSHPIYDPYNTATYTAYITKVDLIRNLTVRNTRIVGGGSAVSSINQVGLSIQYAEKVRIYNNYIGDCGYRGITTGACMDVVIDSNTIRRSNTNSYGYGIAAWGTESCRISNNIGIANRHSIDLNTYGSANASVVSRGVVIAHNIVSEDSSAGLSSHGGSSDVIFHNNIVYNCGGGIVIRGRNTKVRNNVVRGVKVISQSNQTYSHGVFVGGITGENAGTGPAGIDLEISGNDIDMTNPLAAAESFSACGIFMNNILTDAKIFNNKIRGYTCHGIQHKADGGTGILIENNDLKGAQFATAANPQVHGIFLGPTVGDNRKYSDVMIRNNKISNVLNSCVVINGSVGQTDRANDIVISGNKFASFADYAVLFPSGYYDREVHIFSNRILNTPNIATSLLSFTAANFTRTPRRGGNDQGGGSAARLLTSGAELGGALRPGLWYTSPGGSASLAPTVNFLYAVPYYVGRYCTLDSIGLYVVTGTANATLRMGLYADIDDLYGGYPGSLVVDGGLADASAAGLASVSIGQALVPGLYWIAVVPLTAAPASVQGITGSNQTVGAGSVTSGFTNRSGYRQQSGVGSTLPANFGSSVDSVAVAPQLLIKAVS